ncbi:biotin-dependent carboxyltransferase family protein [Pontibacter sp. JAM-7]|uniref:5-oxoprolinase subunit C family protein n=1 Tax=Pontibacter sp. JAM-7 TaxID=3366581 RepID=UPI003AF61E34
MTANGLRVIKPGTLSLVQDLGRWGVQHYGLSPGGALDEHAARWANKLLGNPVAAALLEITLGNVELEADVACCIAMTGAVQRIRLNDQTLPGWRTCQLQPGDRLRVDFASSGQRSYLAVAGGFLFSSMFGSVASVEREQVGAFAGRPLQAGDCLPCGSAPVLPHHRQVPWRYIPDYDAPLVARVIPGYQVEQFDRRALEQFYQTGFILSSDSNRMGFRLKGQPIESGVSGLLSEGICFGAIQIPPDGQPIVLLKDRQTLGGYPKLGSLLPLDAFRLTQCRPGTEVRFETISLQHAQATMKPFYNFFAESG